MSDKPDDRQQVYMKMDAATWQALTDYRRSLPDLPPPSTAVRNLARERLTELGFYPPRPAAPPA